MPNNDRAAQFTAEALARVDAFIVAHPEYTRQGIEQPGQGATNRVVFARRGEDPVVFKVFCEVERKERECFALRHWKETGLVPELIRDQDSRMIVMSHVPGCMLHVFSSRDDVSETTRIETCAALGRAFGSLAIVPLSVSDRTRFEARFYGALNTLEAYLGRILELGRSIQAIDPNFGDDFWKGSLDFIQAQMDTILSQPRILYHQDAGNFHVQPGRLRGFFDLEMCFIGCEAMQVGALLDVFQGLRERWEPFRRGWETATRRPLDGVDLRAALAVYHLLCWRVISRYMSYDGTPGTGYAWASPANPARYRSAIESVTRMLLS